MNNELIALILQAVYSLGAFAVGYWWQKHRVISARYENIEKGVQSLLKVQIRQIHEKDSANSGYPMLIKPAPKICIKATMDLMETAKVLLC